MAAGPGIPPRAAGSPRLAMRSARNYPHLVADELGLDLVDVTYSGATTAHVLREEQNGAPPQVTALHGDETLVTITIGGNDVWYVPGLYAASLPRPLRLVPVLGRGLRSAVDVDQRDRSLVDVAASLREVGDDGASGLPRRPGAVRRLPDAAAPGRHPVVPAAGRRRRPVPSRGRTSWSGSPPRRQPRPAASW